MSTEPTNPLLALFTRSRGELLSLLFRYPDRRFYLRELIQRSRIGVRSAQTDLQAFLQAELIVESLEGRRRYFQANPASPAFKALCALVDSIGGPVGKIRMVLKPLEPDIQIAFIYGSVARKEETRSSDIDLMVVGKLPFGRISDALGVIQDEMDQIINPSVFDPKDFGDRLREGSSFLKRILKEPKLFIVGSKNDIERLAE
jgi:predicted nucleotidyltransferase